MPKLSQIPIIFLTSMTGADVVDRCFNCGGVDYISKPFGFTEIKARIRTHLGLKRATDALHAWNVELARGRSVSSSRTSPWPATSCG